MTKQATPDMIERVARALCEAFGSVPDENDLYVPPHTPERAASKNWQAFEEQARAAIEAMRTPTEAMASAFDDAWSSSHMTEFLDGWTAAIDAALATQNTEER